MSKDRIDDWRTFVAVATHKSFVKAARSLGRSPQAMTRAIAALEARLDARLLHRTTRSVSLTSEGARLLERARRVLDEVDQLEAPLDPKAKLSGTLTITAPILFGQLHVTPIVVELLREHPELTVRLLLVDRVVALAEEGVDVAVRIGALQDSALRTRVVGAVRPVLCAAPEYLRRAGTPRTPHDLVKQGHACIAFTGTTPIPDRWSFPTSGDDIRERTLTVHVRPRLIVTTGQAAVDAALAGLGIVRLLSYQVARAVERKQLRTILEAHMPPPLPVQLVHLPGIQARAAPLFIERAAQRITRLLAT